MKRMFSTLLVVCLLAQPMAPVRAQQTAVISLASMDRGSVRPFDRLVITGTGFLPATAAISVVFAPKQHGVPIVIPAFSATTTQVEVIVPTFLDPVTGDFGFGQADVQVVQVTRDQVMSSNVLSGLDVAPMPVLPESASPGKLTRAFMRMSVKLLTAGDASSSQEARAAFRAFKDEQAALLTIVEGVVAQPNVSVAARTIDAAPLMVNGQMLKTSDRILAAYLTSIPSLVSTQGLSGDRVRALADESCAYDAGNASFDGLICQMQTSILAASRNWITGVALIAGGVVTVASLSVIGVPLMGVVGGVSGLMVIAGGIQLASLDLSSTLIPAILSPDAPPLLSTLRDHLRKMFESANETGLPVTSTETAAADALTQVAARERSTPNGSPQGGTIVSAQGPDQGVATREMSAFQGNGTSTSATRIGVATTQSTRTIFDARLLAPSVSWFDGAYLGSMSLTGTGGGYPDESFSLDLAFTVLNGIVTIIIPTGGSGTISTNGRLTSNILGNCSLSGAIEARAATGPATAGGSLPLCADGRGYTGWGTWTANRAPRP